MYVHGLKKIIVIVFKNILKINWDTINDTQIHGIYVLSTKRTNDSEKVAF